MPDRKTTFRREKLVHRYIAALDRGDVDALQDVLQMAARDPLLERMILDVNDAYRPELPPAPSFVGRNNHREDRMFIGQPYPTLHRRPYRGYAVLTLASATVAALLLVAGFVLLNARQDSSSGLWLQSEDANEALFRRYHDEIWNQGNIASLGEFLTPDSVRHDNGMDLEGIEAHGELVSNLRTAIPDMHFDLLNLTAVGDEVWAYSVGRGTPTGPMTLSDGTPLQPSGDPVDIRAMIRSRFAGGKIAEMWVEYDTLSIFQQLGVVPALSTLATEGANKAVIQRLFDEAMDGDNLDILDEVYAPSFQWYRPNNMGSITYTVASWKADWFTSVLAEGFPDHQFVLESLIAEGDKVVLQYRFTATRAQDVYSPMGRVVPGTGAPIEWEGVIIYRLEDGKIVEEWWYWDNPDIERIDLGVS